MLPKFFFDYILFHNMAADDFYDRLGDLLKDRLNSDEDPFEAWNPNEGKTRSAGGRHGRTAPKKRRFEEERIPVPRELVEEYLTLGQLPGVSAQTCKAAWKRLIKLNHPDRFAGQNEESIQATAKSIRITEAYRRIARWFETGKLD